MIDTVEFLPENELEECLQKAQKGEVDHQEFLSTLQDSVLFVPSGNEVKDDLSGFVPLLFKKEDAQLVSVFTSQSRLEPFKNFFGVRVKTGYSPAF